MAGTTRLTLNAYTKHSVPFLDLITVNTLNVWSTATRALL